MSILSILDYLHVFIVTVRGVALELDSTVQSVILDVDVDRGILDLGIRPELIESTNVLAQIKSKKKKNRDKKLEIWPDSILEATIELVKVIR